LAYGRGASVNIPSKKTGLLAKVSLNLKAKVLPIKALMKSFLFMIYENYGNLITVIKGNDFLYKSDI
jgi:hypothetical protein